MIRVKKKMNKRLKDGAFQRTETEAESARNLLLY